MVQLLRGKPALPSVSDVALPFKSLGTSGSLSQSTLYASQVFDEPTAILDFGTHKHYYHGEVSLCQRIGGSELILDEANGFVCDDSLTVKCTFEVDDAMMELPIPNRPTSLVGSEPTERNLFPRYFPSEFTDFVLLPGDPSAPGVLYDTLSLCMRPLVNQAMVAAMEAVSLGERSSLNAGGEFSAEEDFPTLDVRVPRALTEFDGVKLEELPAKSVLAYIVSLLGGMLDIPEKAHMEDLVMLCHVIHLYRWHNFACQSLVVTLRNAIFRQYRSAINFPWLFYVAWVECNQDKVLLNLLARFLRSDPSNTVAVIDALAEYATLDMHLFLELHSCITERRNIAHDPEVGDLSIQQSLDEIVLGLTEDSEEDGFLLLSSIENAEPVRVIPEIMHARWHAFREVMSESRTAMLPFSRAAIEAIALLVLSNGKHRPELDFQDSLMVLEKGGKFGLSLDAALKSTCPPIFYTFICNCFTRVFQDTNPLLVLHAAHALNVSCILDRTLEKLAHDPRSALKMPGNLDLALNLPKKTRRIIFQQLLDHEA